MAFRGQMENEHLWCDEITKQSPVLNRGANQPQATASPGVHKVLGVRCVCKRVHHGNPGRGEPGQKRINQVRANKTCTAGYQNTGCIMYRSAFCGLAGPRFLSGHGYFSPRHVFA